MTGRSRPLVASREDLVALGESVRAAQLGLALVGGVRRRFSATSGGTGVGVP